MKKISESPTPTFSKGKKFNPKSLLRKGGIEEKIQKGFKKITEKSTPKKIQKYQPG